MTDTHPTLRLLDLILDAQADGSNPLDAGATHALVKEAVTTAIIQDALALGYTDAELVALLAEVAGQRIICTRCTGGRGAANCAAFWLLTSSPDITRDEPTPETLAMWRDARRQ